MTKPAVFLTPAQLCDRWDDAVTVLTLANWRSKGKGPAFQKFGARVRYPLAQVIAWEALNLHHTNDNQPTIEAEVK